MPALPTYLPSPIQNDLRHATFWLIILGDFHLTLVPCMQYMATDLRSNISTFSSNLVLNVFTFTLQELKFLSLLSSDVVTG